MHSSDWGRLLLIGVGFLPLPFFSFIFLRTNDNRRRRRLELRWALLFLFFLSLFSIIFSSSSLTTKEEKEMEMEMEIQQLKIKLSKLEFILEDNMEMLNSRTLHLNENSKRIQEMEENIKFLHNSLSMIKTSQDSSKSSEEMVKIMEEEIRLLWAESRKNNFNYHILESKAYEKEIEMKALTAEVEKMENIVTEQWVQIQQLEQALQTMKIMASKVRKKSEPKVHKKQPREWSVLKVIKGVRRRYLPEVADLPDTFFLGNYISKSSISRAYDHLKTTFLAAKRWHHELQNLVKWALERNEFTAPLANKEVIFFVASAIIIIPIFSVGFVL
ncbi:uncharacterized protein M6B38_144625 [Iris pallida]|uniref:Uncharacterized protein n=1 Tax=Iris pallida TaxID=29817 RepID=A0AAX6F9U1_IRIPA|nr:uncharacterized protein M6B38_144625 [Iris pallida]